eukprot:gnl/Spiro4/25662_TR12782_c0_g1_i1.p1 gnl/Spiro4/25662_TR12782_c0_g1~~gnl/Spiro4/25662_TR12782_c0_g1_i1.p1  ORF type:complete len:406 (+),score=81.43 gnl/Spiro4/25662_TR12782_c0_g1_i1:61-1218(+)
MEEVSFRANFLFYHDFELFVREQKTHPSLAVDADFSEFLGSLFSRVVVNTCARAPLCDSEELEKIFPRSLASFINQGRFTSPPSAAALLSRLAAAFPHLSDVHALTSYTTSANIKRFVDLWFFVVLEVLELSENVARDCSWKSLRPLCVMRALHNDPDLQECFKDALTEDDAHELKRQIDDCWARPARVVLPAAVGPAVPLQATLLSFRVTTGRLRVGSRSDISLGLGPAPFDAQIGTWRLCMLPYLSLCVYEPAASVEFLTALITGLLAGGYIGGDIDRVGDTKLVGRYEWLNVNEDHGTLYVCDSGVVGTLPLQFTPDLSWYERLSMGLPPVAQAFDGGVMFTPMSEYKYGVMVMDHCFVCVGYEAEGYTLDDVMSALVAPLA